jgi:hypothetical protein
MVFHPGVKFAPRGELVEEWRGEQRISPPGDNFTRRGQNSPPWDNFAPVGQILPLGAKLRMGLRDVAVSVRKYQNANVYVIFLS